MPYIKPPDMSHTTMRVVGFWATCAAESPSVDGLETGQRSPAPRSPEPVQLGPCICFLSSEVQQLPSVCTSSDASSCERRGLRFQMSNPSGSLQLSQGLVEGGCLGMQLVICRRSQASYTAVCDQARHTT